jgi:hypothetical protein
MPEGTPDVGPAHPTLKLMVSSTVYGLEGFLEHVFIEAQFREPSRIRQLVEG